MYIWLYGLFNVLKANRVTSTYDWHTFYVLGQKLIKILVVFLENCKRSKRHSEINRPLALEAPFLLMGLAFSATSFSASTSVGLGLRLLARFVDFSSSTASIFSLALVLPFLAAALVFLAGTFSSSSTSSLTTEALALRLGARFDGFFTSSTCKGKTRCQKVKKIVWQTN